MDITKLLAEKTKDVLSEETITQIKEAFDSAVEARASLQTEKALAEQDAAYAAKLEHLIEVTDADRIKKLRRVVEAIDYNNASKLQQVVKRYSRALNEQANSLRDNLVNRISNYLDLYLEEVIPQEAINEAVRNNKARIVLENFRKSLAIDVTLMKESVKDAILDGKKQLDAATKQTSSLKSTVETLEEQLKSTKAELILEQKTAHLPKEKQAYARRVLAGKTADFIAENVDYTVSLFDKQEEERLGVLKEEALTKHVMKDRVVVEEQSKGDDTFPIPQQIYSYVEELKRG